MKVVIIDDIMSNCKLLQLHLKRWGFETEIYDDSLEAFEVLKLKTEPYIAIVDWLMPELDGVELCKRIRSEHNATPNYFILLTAKSSMEDIVTALDAGADDFLSKPFNLKELKSRVKVAVRTIKIEIDLLDNKQELEKLNINLKNNLKKIEDDEIAGKKVQESLLPKPKFDYESYNVSFLLYPSLYLSGDFLDYFMIDNRYLVFYIIDVAGHGASSAFITILVKSYISNKINLYHSGIDKDVLNPSSMISLINKTLVNDKLGKHLVMFYGVIDTQENRLSYTNAGYFPFPVIHTRNESHFLRDKAFLVGIMKAAKYETLELELPDSFSLLIFSDGVLELLHDYSLKEQEAKIIEIINIANDDLQFFKDRFELSDENEYPDDISIFKITKK